MSEFGPLKTVRLATPPTLLGFSEEGHGRMEADQRKISVRIGQHHNQEPAEHFRRGERGLTLIEVFFAIFVLMVGIMAVASMQISSIWGNAFAGRVTEATTLAGDRLEILQTLPYDDDDLSAGNHTDSDPPENYAIAWNVVEDDTFDNTKTIVVTVAWTERGAQKLVSLQRIRAK